MADFSTVLTQLRAERAKLDAAIQAIEGLTPGNRAAGTGARRPASASRATKARGGSRISAAGRARIAAAARARWAALRAKKKADKK